MNANMEDSMSGTNKDSDSESASYANKKVVVSARVAPEVRELLRTIAAISGRTMGQVVTDWVRDTCERIGLPAVPGTDRSREDEGTDR